MTYTITVKPTPTPGKVNASSTNGHTLTTSTPLLDSAADNYDGNPGQDGRPAGPALQV
jgi:hypothetical protein